MLAGDEQTGRSEILSYQLDWDAGQNQNVWQDLIGYQSAYTGNSHIETNVLAGTAYTFRLRAQNVHGWSDWSLPYIEILAASAPAKMAILTVEEGTLSETSIRVTWATPNSRGSEITGFEFLIYSYVNLDYFSGTEYLGIAVQI